MNGEQVSGVEMTAETKPNGVKTSLKDVAPVKETVAAAKEAAPVAKDVAPATSNQRVAEAVAKIKSEKSGAAASVEAKDWTPPTKAAKAKSPAKAKASAKAKAPKKTSKVKAAAKPKAEAKSKAKAKVEAKPKVKAAAKAKVKKPAAAKTPKAKTKPVSGQSGPPLDLKAEDLNKNEAKLLGIFAAYQGGEKISIKELAKETFPNKPQAQANSWVRNSLRRMVRAGLVENTGRGEYKLTRAGRSLA